MSFKKTVNIFADGDCKPVACGICGGELVPKYGIEQMEGTVPENVCGAYHSPLSGYIFLMDGKQIHVYKSWFLDFRHSYDAIGTNCCPVEESDGDRPFSVFRGGNNLLVSSKTTGYSRREVKWPPLKSAAMHCGRMFGIEDIQQRYKIIWSGDGGPRQWPGNVEEGYVYLEPDRGEALNIFEFCGKLVVVRKFGISVLKMFGSPENFSLEITDTDSSEIYDNTARIVGDKLMFFSADGLCSFDGSAIKLLPSRYGKQISNPRMASSLRYEYFMCCDVEGFQDSVVWCYDTKSGEDFVLTQAAEWLCPMESFMAFFRGGYAYRFVKGGEYSVTSDKINFGSGRFKTVTEVYIDGGEVDLEISNGKITRSFSKVTGVIRPRLRGKNFTFKITGFAPVRAFTATAEECNAI